jgi:hypothetical protein
VRPASAGICTLHETPSFVWRTNAGADLLWEAGATQEQTLYAVRCSALFGAVQARRSSLSSELSKK